MYFIKDYILVSSLYEINSLVLTANIYGRLEPREESVEDLGTRDGVKQIEIE